METFEETKSPSSSLQETTLVSKNSMETSENKMTETTALKFSTMETGKFNEIEIKK